MRLLLPVLITCNNMGSAAGLLNDRTIEESGVMARQIVMQVSH